MVFSLNELRHERAGTLKDQTRSSEDNGDALEERDWDRKYHGVPEHIQGSFVVPALLSVTKLLQHFYAPLGIKVARSLHLDKKRGTCSKMA